MRAPSPRCGAPLQILDIPDERPRDIYGYDLLLLRPDMHVAWRGNAPPEDAEKLVAHGHRELSARQTARRPRMSARLSH